MVSTRWGNGNENTSIQFSLSTLYLHPDTDRENAQLSCRGSWVLSSLLSSWGAWQHTASTPSHTTHIECGPCLPGQTRICCATVSWMSICRTALGPWVNVSQATPLLSMHSSSYTFTGLGLQSTECWCTSSSENAVIQVFISKHASLSRWLWRGVVLHSLQPASWGCSQALAERVSRYQWNVKRGMYLLASFLPKGLFLTSCSLEWLVAARYIPGPLAHLFQCVMCLDPLFRDCLCTHGFSYVRNSGTSQPCLFFSAPVMFCSHMHWEAHSTTPGHSVGHMDTPSHSENERKSHRSLHPRVMKSQQIWQTVTFLPNSVQAMRCQLHRLEDPNLYCSSILLCALNWAPYWAPSRKQQHFGSAVPPLRGRKVVSDHLYSYQNAHGHAAKLYMEDVSTSHQCSQLTMTGFLQRGKCGSSGLQIAC